MRAREGGRGVWLDIMRVGRDIDNLGIYFSSSFVRKVGDEAHISFWRDRWIDGGRLMDMFRRLFHLDRHKDEVVADKGNWVEGMDSWKWLLANNGIFSIKALTKLIEEICINVGNNIGETM
ncbi:hypothetical protein Tco_0926242 [Tanacetum coccineum]|uniref:RNA-directed DNA polymerase, eukaryota, reverse transcriptase zinc-binding domain protein n=1 Tax=Tanacetum coccineum TaxID=301880 RepID=A0ABQ5DB82_9ASTR